MMNVAIIGGGRMGSLLVSLLSPHHKIICIEKDKAKGCKLFLNYGIMVSDKLEFTVKADIIILALPSEAIPAAIKDLAEFTRPGQILINIATSNDTSKIRSSVNIPLISAKIVGHFQEIANGEAPLILIDPGDMPRNHENILTVAEVFSKVGIITFGNEKTVLALNSIASEEGLRCAYAIKQRLNSSDIPEDLYSFAIRNVAAGTMKAFANGEAGPFAQKIIEKIQLKRTGD
jgi:pyrroline-5-carboxylate reductase